MLLSLSSVNDYLPPFRADAGFCQVLRFLPLLSPLGPSPGLRFPPEGARGESSHKVT